jgi:hypothetical protein
MEASEVSPLSQLAFSIKFRPLKRERGLLRYKYFRVTDSTPEPHLYLVLTD